MEMKGAVAHTHTHMRTYSHTRTDMGVIKRSHTHAHHRYTHTRTQTPHIRDEAEKLPFPSAANRLRINHLVALKNVTCYAIVQL